MRTKTLPVHRLGRLLAASAVAATLVVGSLPGVAFAAAPPAPYFNGFEASTDAMTPQTADGQAMFNVSRVTSGPDGIASSEGSHHAQAAASTASQFTRLGGYSSTFPVGGYTTSIDIYLNTTLATGSNDLRFDWSSAINNPAGSHRRDFIFNVGTDPSAAGQFKVSASNNTPGWPSNPDRDPLTISDSGWYTLQHSFRDAGAGVLAVDMAVLDAAGSTLDSWTLSDPSDVIGATVGGNRYGSLFANGFTLALDNIVRSGVTPKCTPTGLFRDTIDLTAAVINPTEPVTGTVDATTCNIGVYYGPGHSGTVTSADVYGANYYGVVANAAAVDISNSTIHDIGETPLDGSQHGVGVLYTTITQANVTTGPSATGILSGTTITDYQKNGVVVSGDGAKVTVKNNVVTGQGPIAYIAQNGIQVSFGGAGTVTGNTVSDNWYAPAGVTACGLLFYQASGVKQSANTFSGNETNVCNAGRGGGNVRP